MKKVIAICAMASVFAACTGNETKVETAPAATDSTTVATPADSTAKVDTTKTVAIDTTKVN